MKFRTGGTRLIERAEGVAESLVRDLFEPGHQGCEQRRARLAIGQEPRISLGAGMAHQIGKTVGPVVADRCGSICEIDGQSFGQRAGFAVSLPDQPLLRTEAARGDRGTAYGFRAPCLRSLLCQQSQPAPRRVRPARTGSRGRGRFSWRG